MNLESTHIAIVGIGCRFPQAETPQAFWKFLQDGKEAIIEVPKDRWDIDEFYDPNPATPGKMNTRWGSFLKKVDEFDPAFFGISPREAEYIDPQQRLMLEVAWEALENAAIAPERLDGSQTGVFIGFTNFDYHTITYKDLSCLEAYSGIGSHPYIIAARLSYVLNLRGPSIAMDTACSSSLVALHYACQSLKTGESNVCIAGGVNIILSPEPTITFSHARMMAADGRCKTFDAAADGYVRGEGCGVVVLKRLSDALRDGDNIQAIIRGSAVNQDGLSNGLTAPNGPAQQAVIRQALANAGVKPSQISYVETHGTGTSLGDPIEVNSLKTVLMEGREPNQPCWIGSVKTNIGHLESAAGIAGLIKVVLSLQHSEIPPHLHLKKLNPYIKIKNTPIQIPTELQQWPAQGQPRLAGVSAFSYGGTNAHVILEEAPPQVKSQNLRERSFHLLTLSAKTEPAVQALVSRYQHHLETNPKLGLADICYTANTGREHFQHRLAVVADSTEQLIEQLASANHTFSNHPGKKPSKIAFLFTGQGSQYINMGRQLYEQEQIFRQTIDQCNEILRPYLQNSLLEILYPQQATQEVASLLLDQTAYTQPALFALEYALYQVWKSWGITPDVVMGHSVGEYVAAVVAGVLSLEDGLKLIAHRGRLMQQLPAGGEMVSVMGKEEMVRETIAPFHETVAIAAINGPESIVISGASVDIAAICDKLATQGVKTKRLLVSHAFHSPLMTPMLAEFSAIANSFTYNQPQIPLVSNVTGKLAEEDIATAQYWVNHVCQAVQFASGMQTLHQLGYEVFVEIGSKPILLGMGRQCQPASEDLWLPSLRPGFDEWQVLLSSLGQLYVAGFQVDWLRLDREYGRQKVILPTYPFQRQRYWFETGKTHPQKQYLPKIKNLHPLLGQKLRLAGSEEQRFESQLSISEPAYLNHHRVFNKPVLPATAYLEMALAAGAAIFKSDHLILEDVNIYQALIFSEAQDKTVQIVLKPLETNIYKFEIFSLSTEQNQENQSFTLHASGKVLKGKETDDIGFVNLSVLQQEYTEKVAIEILYRELEDQGMIYGPSFQAVKNLWKTQDKILGLIQLSPELSQEAEKYKIHPALLDSCLHSVYGLKLDIDRVNSIDIYLPIKIERLKVYRCSSSQLWSQVEISYKDTSNKDISSSNALLFDNNGVVVAEIEGLIGKRVSRQSLLNVLQRQLLGEIQSRFYQIEWEPQSHHLKTNSQKLSHWLIFADSTGLGTALATKLQQQGHECTLVHRGHTYQNEKTGQKTQTYQLNPSHPQDFEQIYQDILKTSQLPLQKVIHLWSLDAPVPQDLTISGLEQSQLWGCGSVLHLLQAIVKNPTASSPQLWLITKGSQPVSSKTEKLAVAQSPLWGFGRGISLEYPQLWGGLIDLDPQATEDEAEILLQIFTDNSQEDHLARRGGQTYISRLVKQPPTVSLPMSLSSNATYLITGGLGALGLHTAQWMVDKGARYLVLISRSQPSNSAKSAISRLQQQGAKIVELQADVCNFAELASVFEQIDTSMPPLKGIVHAAGVAGYQPMGQMELSQLEAVMRPKVIGGWILHQLTQDKELDFFVNFSSIAGVWGAAGQAHYAAANHFLDGLTYYRQAMGLPSFSVSWGPWAGGGMADEEGLRELSKRGVEPLSPEQAIAALEHLWTSGSVQTAIADVDWSLFKQLYGIGRQRLLLEKIEVEPQPTKPLIASKNATILQEIEEKKESDRLSLLIAYLQRQVGRIVGFKGSQLPSTEQKFFEMGMDSLMVVELRNQIQTDLKSDVSINTFMEGATIVTLANQLNYQLAPNVTQTVEPEKNEQFQLVNAKVSDWIEIEI
ncbi:MULTISPECIES: type I polyketide synthase [Nostoc]|uniref:SDR family NAD(P)-dependent oxidoreductase n=1 Tax=Nostoc paludosum FACHB-159 TaxID=2692908 RepID=A0ABR8K4J5_9NOSO|nr:MULTISPECIES: type I polyketide synthase [Nostoc]MBD2676938.1 SDR family NAD(P)-dependent oxidoreductase [Nostoc sp. FACHB-857]MBD2733137.1 SDR family NAD(P)-dependent oxidoreductase [Nostoc paludosum FACHB-159]